MKKISGPPLSPRIKAPPGDGSGEYVPALVAQELRAALEAVGPTLDRLEQMTGYREGQGDLWAGPAFWGLRDQIRAALRAAETKEAAPCAV